MVEISKTQSTPPTLLATGDLSPATQCELIATHYADDDRSFQSEQRVRHQGRMTQIMRDGPFLFRAYTQYKRDLNEERVLGDDGKLASTPNALLTAILNDTDLDRRQIITDYITQSGCHDPVLASILFSVGVFPLLESLTLIRSAKTCYEGLLVKARHDYELEIIDKANTTSAVHRSMKAMQFLGENATLISGPVKRVLVVGAGLDYVPLGFSTTVPTQINEPFLVMDTVLNHFSASLDDLNIDVADINPRVIRHLMDAKEKTKRGELYSLNLHWDSYHGFWGESPVAHLPLREQVHIKKEDKVHYSKMSDDFEYTLYWDRADLDSRILDHIHPRQCDIANDAAGEESQYDLIIMLHVAHYLNNTERMLALDNMANALRPGGLLFTDGLEMEVTPNDTCRDSLRARLETVAYDDRRKLFLLQKQ